MGLPAVELDRRTRSSRPRLRVVKPVRARRRRTKRGVGASRQAFSVCCVVLAGVALFGVGRVMLVARATEASIRSSELRQDIKAERLTGDMLEVDRSSLTVPSRIENIAGATMQMAEADSIEYMALPATALNEPAEVNQTAEKPAVEVGGSYDQEGVANVLASVMEMAAGEAQVLLVGDVGIASPE